VPARVRENRAQEERSYADQEVEARKRLPPSLNLSTESI